MSMQEIPDIANRFPNHKNLTIESRHWKQRDVSVEGDFINSSSRTRKAALNTQSNASHRWQWAKANITGLEMMEDRSIVRSLIEVLENGVKGHVSKLT
jgi:hypothetical protein